MSLCQDPRLQTPPDREVQKSDAQCKKVAKRFGANCKKHYLCRRNQTYNNMEQQKRYLVIAANRLSGKLEILSGWMSSEKAAAAAATIDPTVYRFSAIASRDGQFEIIFKQ